MQCPVCGARAEKTTVVGFEGSGVSCRKLEISSRRQRVEHVSEASRCRPRRVPEESTRLRPSGIHARDQHHLPVRAVAAHCRDAGEGRILAELGPQPKRCTIQSVSGSCSTSRLWGGEAHPVGDMKWRPRCKRGRRQRNACSAAGSFGSLSKERRGARLVLPISVHRMPSSGFSLSRSGP